MVLRAGLCLWLVLKAIYHHVDSTNVALEHWLLGIILGVSKNVLLVRGVKVEHAHSEWI